MYKFKVQIYFFIFYFFSLLNYGQETSIIDNCERIYIEQDSEILKRIDYAYKQVSINPQKSYKIALDILGKARGDNNLKDQIRAHKLLGIVSIFLHKNIESHNHTRLAYQMLTPKLKSSFLGVGVTLQYADFFVTINELDYALEFYKEAAKLLNIVCPNPNIERFLNFTETAGIYKKKEDYKAALNFYKNALEEAEGLHDKLWLSSAYNNIGYFYYIQENIEKALEYYLKAKQYLDISIEGHDLFYANINENIAHIYLADYKQYKKALSIYTQVLETRNKYDKSDLAMQVDISRYLCYIYLNNHKEVKKLENFIDVFFENKREENQNYFTSNHNRYYKIKLFYLKRIKKNDEYIKTSSSYIKYLNEKFNYQKNLNQKVIESYIELQQFDFNRQLSLEKELVVEKEKLIKKRNLFLIIILLLFSLVVTSLLLIIRIRASKRKRIEQENVITKLVLKNTTLEKQKLNEMLKSKQQDIVNIVAESSMRTYFLKNILSKIEETLDGNLNIVQVINPIIFDIKSQIIVEKRLTSLQSNLTEANAYFDVKLIEKFPNLTKMEREICLFIRLNFSVKEIAQIRNVSIDSIKMVRYRIRKKLSISPETELDQFIQLI